MLYKVVNSATKLNKVFMHASKDTSLTELYISNKTEHFNNKGGCGIRITKGLKEADLALVVEKEFQLKDFVLL